MLCRQDFDMKIDLIELYNEKKCNPHKECAVQKMRKLPQLMAPRFGACVYSYCLYQFGSCFFCWTMDCTYFQLAIVTQASFYMLLFFSTWIVCSGAI